MNRLAVFARRPELGRVKTRLSPALPPPVVLALYRGLLEDALAVARATQCDERWLYWAAAPEDDAPNPAPDGFRVREQSGADLGTRLASAFGELVEPSGELVEPSRELVEPSGTLVEPRGARAVVLGADCPELEPRHLADAFAALSDHDLVLGPSHDGGYYLIGLRVGAPEIFRGVRWSSEHVLADTRARAESAGLSIATLEALADLDTPADLVRLIARRLVEPNARESATAAALRSLGLLPAAQR